MASFSYFYDSDQQIYDLIKIYNRQLPHRPSQLKNSKTSGLKSMNYCTNPQTSPDISCSTSADKIATSCVSEQTSLENSSGSSSRNDVSKSGTRSSGQRKWRYGSMDSCLLDRVRAKARRQTSWVMVVATMFVFIPIIGIVFSFGVFIPAMEPDFSVHKTVMGWIASIPIAFLTGANPLSCSLAVRFGYRPVIFVGVLLVVFGLFTMSASSHIMMIFISYSVCVGVGVNFIYNTCMLLLLSYFSIDELQKNLSRACCIASFGFPIGLLVMNPITVRLVDHYGWRVTLRIVALICMCDVIAVYVVMKPPQVNNLMRKYIPRNSRTGSVKRFVRRLLHRDLIFDPVLSLWLLSVTCLWVTLYFVPIHLVSDMLAKGGMNSNEASFVLVVAGLSELAGRAISAIVPNMFGLRSSYFLLPACCCLSGSNLLFGFGQLPTTEYAIVYGVCAGVVNATMIVACKEFFGNIYFHEAWTYSGIVYMTSVVLGNTLGGLPFDLTGKYDMVYKVFGAVHALAFLILLAINCIVFKREQGEQRMHGPLELRNEVSAVYSISTSAGSAMLAPINKNFRKSWTPTESNASFHNSSTMSFASYLPDVVSETAGSLSSPIDTDTRLRSLLRSSAGSSNSHISESSSRVVNPVISESTVDKDQQNDEHDLNI